jgi:hypothetical protein
MISVDIEFSNSLIIDEQRNQNVISQVDFFSCGGMSMSILEKSEVWWTLMKLCP